jgi:hypothetical protein
VEIYIEFDRGKVKEKASARQAMPGITSSLMRQASEIN